MNSIARLYSAILIVLICSLVGCSSKPFMLYEEGSIDDADVVTLDISVERVSVHIDGKKVPIRHSEVRMAPGSYKVKVVPNPSFERFATGDEYDKVVVDLQSRGVPYGTMMENISKELHVEMDFQPQTGGKYTLYCGLYPRPMPESKKGSLPPAEFVAWIESY